MKDHHPIRLFSGTVTGTGAQSPVEVPLHESGETALALIVTNATITTMDVDVEVSPDGGTTWFQFDAFTQATGNTTELDQLAVARFTLMRVNISGFNGTTADVAVYAM